MKKLLLIITLCSIISCQKSATVEPEPPKCVITKISESARDSKNSVTQKVVIEYDNQQRISKVTDFDATNSYLTYSYEKGKIVIKTFSKNDLQYTRSLILNDKNQVIQDLVQNKVKSDTVSYTFNAQGFLSNASLNEYGYSKKIELKYEYNNDGSPSKVITTIIYDVIGLKNTYYKNYEYDNNVAFISMPNKNEIYPKFIHDNIESLFSKVIKSIKGYSSDNKLSSEQIFKYVINTDNKKVKNIIIDSYGTLNGVKDESSLVSNVQEFEYLCK